jgi:hypothetical protein
VSDESRKSAGERMLTRTDVLEGLRAAGLPQGDVNDIMKQMDQIIGLETVVRLPALFSLLLDYRADKTQMMDSPGVKKVSPIRPPR